MSQRFDAKTSSATLIVIMFLLASSAAALSPGAGVSPSDADALPPLLPSEFAAAPWRTISPEGASWTPASVLGVEAERPGSDRDARQLPMGLGPLDPVVMPLSAPTEGCVGHPPILIQGEIGPSGFKLGDDPLTGEPIYRPGSGVRSGTGTADDPYVIEGWCIEPLLLAAGIQLESTSSHVVIRGNDIRDFSIGVRLIGALNIEVRENLLVGNGRGITVTSSSDVAIRENVIEAGDWEGILLSRSHGNLIEGNDISFIRSFWWDGIILEESHDNVIAANVVSESWYGIGSYYATGNQYIDNVLDGNLLDIVLIISEGDVLSGNEMNGFISLVAAFSSDLVLTGNDLGSGILLDGVTLAHFRHSIDATNLVAGRPVQYLWEVSDTMITGDIGQVIVAGSSNVTLDDVTSEGVVIPVTVAFSSGVTVQESTIEGSYFGILVVGSGSVTITGSTFFDNLAGIIFFDSDFGYIEGNTLVGNPGVSVVLYVAHDTVVTNNTMMDAYSGIDVVWSSRNVISNNAFSDNLDGVFILDASANLIVDNIVTNNYGGIVVLYAPGNTIRGNNLEGNVYGGVSMGAAVNMTLNWWGCPEGPTDPGCDRSYGDIAYTPWLSAPNPHAGPGQSGPPVDPPIPEPPLPPEPVDPRVTQHLFDGRIGCAVSQGPVFSNDLCASDGAAPTRFNLTMDRGVTTLHVEMRWVAEGRFGAERLQFYWMAPAGVGGVEGTSPLVHEQAFDWDDPWTHNARDAALQVRIGKDQGVTMGQEFELCVFVGYGDVEIPETSCFETSDL